ncbi:peptide ABC transporter substrate-binding protein [Faecalibacterium prausnitzii]|jgi:ABC-type oligopeptide transport system, periplasmic component|uniref:Twin-arginine translocation signal domain-containing protein n=1 Tax=Faecalibacterium prausnitzii TaxID=853 RepID=A0A6A8KBN4_9FIRM|nr:peptide ABC transporter substrate-binding protein [Faecalibacterium prausnitzii]MSC44913.1 twin-arginine translocation signal domain-containing protein [Faecalibacterium prausnitzii]MSC47852.1 twin-arginine translocation signal domain-containing protein [Faecalibacterium prausnitzii]MSC67595.1 twin-arginine translocation signal domain-containing protein [Faecalibacterium prausnitzii]MSC73598.1 twin-arginine translocation signal domain-containing protein [Faecalibacterium prausnitzii]MSC7982
MKRISRRNFLKVAGVGAAALGLAACGGSKSGSTATSGTASSAGSSTGSVSTAGFTVQYGSNPETLDPALNSAVDGGNTIITVFETLLIINENNEAVPGQAESWTTSEDGLTWTFTMRDGLKWSDGTDLNAKDFEYSFKRMANPDTAAPYAETCLGMIDGFEEAAGFPDADGNPTVEPNLDALNVKASDDGKTLTIVLAYPCSYFDKIVAFAAMSPVQKATVEANGDAWCTSPDTYVCNGPFMITEWTPSERIVLTKNPNYVGGWDSSKIVSESITLLLLEDSSASFAAYNSGEAQLIKDVPTDEIPSLTKAEDGGDFYVDTILGTYYVSLNLKRDAFKDAKVRRALSLAIDRDYVANTIMQGTYSTADSIVGPGIVDENGYFHDNGNAPYISADYEANLAEAKKLLADAGYPNGEGYPTLEYSTNDAGYHVPLAEYLQQAWSDLGITLTISKMEWSSFTAARRAGEYDVARNGWVMDYNDPSNMLDLFCSGNGNNDGKYSNPEFDAAIEASRVADVSEHFAQLHKAEDILMEDTGCLPIAYYNDYWLQSPALKGTWHSPYGYWYLQYGYIEE